jgi:TP901 family phage tail tape measure protein
MANLNKLISELKELERLLISNRTEAATAQAIMDRFSGGSGGMEPLKGTLIALNAEYSSLSAKAVELSTVIKAEVVKSTNSYDKLITKLQTVSTNIANVQAQMKSGEVPIGSGDYNTLAHNLGRLTTQQTRYTTELEKQEQVQNRLKSIGAMENVPTTSVQQERALTRERVRSGINSAGGVTGTYGPSINEVQMAQAKLNAAYEAKVLETKQFLLGLSNAVATPAPVSTKTGTGLLGRLVSGGEGTGFASGTTGGNTLPPKPPTPAQVRDAAAKAREAALRAYVKEESNAKEVALARRHGFDPETDFKGSTGFAGGAYRTSDWSRPDDRGGTYREKIRVDSMGNASTGFIPKANQSFAQGIGKDLGDLMKWSIAISAIYGPLNAMSEAMAQLISNEVKLATVSIALNTNAATTATVFKDVYAASKTAGEEVSLIIDAFGAAYTAAGRINNEYQRYTATVQLLDDAMKLSKLSTLDEAGAIDVLTAALYQTAKAPTPGATGSDTAAAALERGSDLIDQWVQVSKVAAVTVETLATGVAVLGDSAETAGMSIEQMNAMIATLSEVSLSSGKETANIAKALIGNYQQESAVKELNRLGIAVVDTTGKTRQFLDVMTDVANLRSSGILGDEDFSRLTLALGGGGIRRQKDVSAFIENFGRMQQLSGMQGDAGGASAEALAKQLDTVQTSTTNLQNSFVNLAQTMGNDVKCIESRNFPS